MKLAVSNIAWPVEHDTAVADALTSLGVAGIEIAPTKIWPSLPDVTDVQVDQYRQFWESRGISIVAAQALLFGRPDLVLFKSAEARGQTLDYLRSVIRVCARAGAKALVFGSPKNRWVGTRNRDDVWQEAVDFFGRLGETATAEGTAIVMEANPSEYGADFVTCATEALQLVRAVDHRGFRLHLDTACMTMAGDDPAELIPEAIRELSHFHVSEPQLAPTGTGGVNHDQFALSLASVGYVGWVSIEMRHIDPFKIQNVQESIERTRLVYCNQPYKLL